MIKATGPKPAAKPQPHYALGAWWRHDFQAVFLCDFNYARDFLLLLRAQSADFLEETFEARRRNHAHQPAGRFAEVTIGVWYTARGENCSAFVSNKGFPPNGPL